MKSSILFIGLLLALSSWGCRRSVAPGPPDLSLTDFVIDSFLLVSLPPGGVERIAMTPQLKNIMWLSVRNDTLLGLDLKAPHDLRKLLLPPELKNSGLRIQDFVDDPYSGDWYLCGKGLYRYDSVTRSFVRLVAEHSGVLGVFREYLFYGIRHAAYDEIYMLHKASGAIDTVQQQLGDDWNFSPQQTSFGVLVNHFRYHPDEKQFRPLESINGRALPASGFHNLIEQDSFISFSEGRSRNTVFWLYGRRYFVDTYLAAPQGRVFEDGRFWSLHEGINRWILADNTSKRFEVTLPFQWSHHYLNDDRKYWILSGSIFSFDRKTEQFYQYPQFVNGRAPKQYFQDDRHLYLLYDDVLAVFSKAFLEANKIAFNAEFWAAQKSEYHEFVAAGKNDLSRNVSAERFLALVGDTEAKFSDIISWYGAQDHRYACDYFSEAHFRKDFTRAILAHRVDSLTLRVNWYCLTRFLAHQGELSSLVRLEQYRQKNTYQHLLSDHIYHHQYTSTIDSTKLYFDELRQLERQITDPDSLELLKILALERVCKSGMFCHEGCGGCDFSLIDRQLSGFLKKHPDAPFTSEAAYHQIRLRNAYNHERFTDFVADYELFLKQHSNSPRVFDVVRSLLPAYIYYEDFNVKNKRQKAKNLMDFTRQRYPDYARSEEFRSYEQYFRVHPRQ